MRSRALLPARLFADAAWPGDVLSEVDERLEPPDDTQRLVFKTVDKVDLVFVIDNSISMADKQELLRDAVPTLLERLIDLHVGVVTSSLGGHGGEICSPNSPQANYNPTKNDRAWLLATVREGLMSYDGTGFLAWDPAGNKQPVGDGDVGSFMRSFQDQVVAAGEIGCGLEATQEAWYRFLWSPTRISRSSVMACSPIPRAPIRRCSLSAGR